MLALAADSKAAHQLGIVQTRSHALALHELQRNVAASADRIKTTLTPAL
jgi:hypothetical protein